MADNLFVVTGGAGFIGSHLVRFLLDSGHSVRVLDNTLLPRGGPYIKNLSSRASWTYHQADVCSLDQLRKLFVGVNGVFHLAACSKIKDCIQNPRLAVRTNVGGTLNVLLAAREMGVKRVVYVSSASVYGNQEELPLREDMEVRPLNPYGLTKYQGEVLGQMFAELCGLETISLRLFNIYGSQPAIAGEADCPGVVELFLKNRRSGQPLGVVGDGSQRRDLAHVADAARACLVAMSSPAVGRGEVVNVGYGGSFGIMEIANAVGGSVTRIPERYSESKDTLADITRAKELLGWVPEINLFDWLKRLTP